jgi:hypothetical protein
MRLEVIDGTVERTAQLERQIAVERQQADDAEGLPGGRRIAHRLRQVERQVERGAEQIALAIAERQPAAEPRIALPADAQIAPAAVDVAERYVDRAGQVGAAAGRIARHAERSVDVVAAFGLDDVQHDTDSIPAAAGAIQHRLLHRREQAAATQQLRRFADAIGVGGLRRVQAGDALDEPGARHRVALHGDLGEDAGRAFRDRHAEHDALRLELQTLEHRFGIEVTALRVLRQQRPQACFDVRGAERASRVGGRESRAPRFRE